MTEKPEHAIVIGGSLAGLMAARLLYDHFRNVTVLERDRLPDHAASRPGVPQDRHVHVLLQRGATIMRRLFPGLEDDLETAGAHCYACSRILLESVLRRRVAALPNVRLRDGAQVQGLVAGAGRVSGVRVHWKDEDADGVEYGGFVVDASGRSSRTPQWLAELGYGEPEESV